MIRPYWSFVAEQQDRISPHIATDFKWTIKLHMEFLFADQLWYMFLLHILFKITFFRKIDITESSSSTNSLQVVNTCCTALPEYPDEILRNGVKISIDFMWLYWKIITCSWEGTKILAEFIFRDSEWYCMCLKSPVTWLFVQQQR